MKAIGKVFILVLLFRIPLALATDDPRVSYNDMTDAAKRAVQEFLQKYEVAVAVRLADLGDQDAQLIAKMLQQAIFLEYMNRNEEAYALETQAYERFPGSPFLLARMAYVSYARGMLYSEEPGDRSVSNFKKGVEYARKCLEKHAEYGECWFMYGANLGRYITGIGIFKTISHIKEVHDSFEKSARFTHNKPFPFGPMGLTSEAASLMGMTEFYRVCPDWWMMEVIAGIRGDRKKSYEYSQKIDPRDFDRANIKAKAAFCYGATSKNQKIINEGIAVVRQAAKYDVIHPLHYYPRNNILLLNKIIKEKNLKIEDYYKLGCQDFEEP